MCASENTVSSDDQGRLGAGLQVNDLVARAEWCRRYAQINSVGLRKILKKHDKMCRNRAGHTYMQVRSLLGGLASPMHHIRHCPQSL